MDAKMRIWFDKEDFGGTMTGLPLSLLLRRELGEEQMSWLFIREGEGMKFTLREFVMENHRA